VLQESLFVDGTTLNKSDMEQTVFSSRSRPPLPPSQTTSSSPRSIPRNLDLRPAETVATSNNWINDLSLGLQQICGSPPPVTSLRDSLQVSATRYGDSSSVSSNSSGVFEIHDHHSPSTPPSASPSSSSRSYVVTPTKSPTIAAGLVSPVIAAFSPVYCDCSHQQQQQQVRQHRRSTPSPPVVIGLPPIPEPTTAVSPSITVPVVSRSRRTESGVFRRTLSLMGAHHINCGSPSTSLRSRPIIVRHVETRERLDKQLSSICGGRAPVAGTSPTAAMKTGTTQSFDGFACEQLTDASEASQRQHRSASSSVVHRSLDVVNGSGGSGGIKLRVNVTPYQPEDLVVSVRPSGVGDDGRHMSVDVEAIQGVGPIGLDYLTECLHHSDLLLSPDCVKHLMCHVTAAGWLYVREHRPTITTGGTGSDDGGEVDGVLSVDFGAGEQSYVPVMYCNEDRLELTFVLHLPEGFRFEDVGVKTVDDRVVVTSGGLNFGRSPSPRCQFSIDGISRFSSPSTGSPRSGLRVVIPLPDGTDNRSVYASLSPKNQLIIVARLSSDSWRRYTF